MPKVPEIVQDFPGVTDPVVLGVLRQMLTELGKMTERVESLEDRFVSSFPAGDPESHRRYHEELIEKNAELRRLRAAIQEKTISGLVWSCLVGIGLAVWNYVRIKI